MIYFNYVRAITKGSLGNISPRLSTKSEAFASEFLENLKAF